MSARGILPDLLADLVAPHQNTASRRAANGTVAPLRVLVDLKPALDGYAGIPQESRLLYRSLSAIPTLHVEGLIQHGSRRLRPALTPGGKALSNDRRINRLSRFVVSLYQNPHSSLLEVLQDKLSRLYARQWMGAKIHLGVSLPMSQFDSTLFEDFVWRTFFSKTLNAKDKPLVKNAFYRVLTESRHMMHSAGLAGLRYSQNPGYPMLDTRDFDYFLTQTPFPGRLKPSSTMIVRYHDAVPILMPHTINDKAFHQASHYHTLKDNVASGAWFSCISRTTRADLLKIFPQAESRSSVIHNMVSDEYSTESSSPGMVHQIVRNRLAPFEEAKLELPASIESHSANCFRYLLMVSTIEPRKNHLLLMQAWEQLRYTLYPDLKIIFVGNTGWDYGPVLRSFKPWAERGDLFWLNNVPSAELRVLYQHAAITVCPGLAEGFDYSGVEAMKCGGVVAASDIPVHREIYQDASAYFDAYDPEDAAAVLHSLLEEGAGLRLDAFRQAATRVSALYSAQAVMPEWAAFFAHLQTLRRRQSKKSP
jgi:glycosyltransferase involved in cell wall biosynthesis